MFPARCARHSLARSSHAGPHRNGPPVGAAPRAGRAPAGVLQGQEEGRGGGAGLGLGLGVDVREMIGEGAVRRARVWAGVCQGLCVIRFEGLSGRECMSASYRIPRRPHAERKAAQSDSGLELVTHQIVRAFQARNRNFGRVGRALERSTRFMLSSFITAYRLALTCSETSEPAPAARAPECERIIGRLRGARRPRRS